MGIIGEYILVAEGIMTILDVHERQANTTWLFVAIF
jgi:hypothetical protein